MQAIIALVRADSLSQMRVHKTLLTIPRFCQSAQSETSLVNHHIVCADGLGRHVWTPLRLLICHLIKIAIMQVAM